MKRGNLIRFNIACLASYITKCTSPSHFYSNSSSQWLRKTGTPSRHRILLEGGKKKLAVPSYFKELISTETWQSHNNMWDNKGILNQTLISKEKRKDHMFNSDIYHTTPYLRMKTQINLHQFRKAQLTEFQLLEK